MSQIPRRAFAGDLGRRRQNRRRTASHRAKIFQDVPRVLGPTLFSFGGKVVSAFGLFERLPMANLMISSVPGPPIPLWLSGYSVVSAAPYGPLVGAISLEHHRAWIWRVSRVWSAWLRRRMSDLAVLRDYIVEEAAS